MSWLREWLRGKSSQEGARAWLVLVWRMGQEEMQVSQRCLCYSCRLC